MKKLMFAAAVATALVTQSQAVTSDIVGYGTKETTTALYTGVGAFFFNVGGAETIDLFDITVVSDGGSGYMDPDDEYLRDLNPASAGNLHRYAYLNEQAIKDILEADELTPAQEALIGWWECPSTGDSLWELIPDGNYEWQLKRGDVSINPRKAFLGQFYGTDIGGPNHKFICSGKVIEATTELQTGAALYYLFHNWTPASCMLTDVEVESEGGSGYMDPDDEYIRQLNPASAGNLHRYAYLNEQAIKDMCEVDELTPAQMAMIGWWECPTTGDSLWDLIPQGDTAWQIKDGAKPDVTLTPGFAFLGQFYGTDIGGPNHHIKFPNPTAAK